jgi:hypothetical protein
MADTKFKGGTIILPCKCEHADQDAMYGKGMRVHNIAEGNGQAYCTVCTPRSLPCERNGTNLDAMPNIGFRGILARRLRIGKEIFKR